MIRVLLSTVALALCAALTPGQPAAPAPLEAKKLAEKIAPFLDEGTFAILYIDLATFDPARMKPRLATLARTAMPPWDEVLAQGSALRAKLLAAGVRGAYVVVNASEMGQAPLLVFPVAATPSGDALLALADALPDGVKPMHGCLVSGSPARIRTLFASKNVNPVPALLPDLTAAFGVGGDKVVARLALVLPPSLRRVLDENLPANLPAQLGGGSSKVLTQGLRWGAVALEGSPEVGFKVRLHIEASNADTALKLVKLTDASLKSLQQAIDADNEFVVRLPVFKELLKHLVFERQDSTLALTLEDKALVTALLPAIAQARGAAGAARDSNSLKQIGLAMHNHLDQHKGKFPTQAITDNQGQPMLSWRVRLLPYLGEQKLYEKFKLDEPWDSDHNKKLLKEMPAVFRTSLAPKLAAEGKTTFVVPIGPDTIFPPGKAVGITDIQDGTSNTILAIEIDAAGAVPWTKPADLNVDLKKPLAGLGFDANGMFHVLFADGSVRRIKKTIAPKTMAALFTRAGGEVVGDF